MSYLITDLKEAGYTYSAHNTVKAAVMGVRNINRITVSGISNELLKIVSGYHRIVSYVTITYKPTKDTAVIKAKIPVKKN